MFLAGPWSLLCGMPKGAFLLTLPQRSVPIRGQPGKVLSMRIVVEFPWSRAGKAWPLLANLGQAAVTSVMLVLRKASVPQRGLCLSG